MELGQEFLAALFPRKTQIMAAEAVAVLTALVLTPEALANRELVWFIDNESALSSLDPRRLQGRGRRTCGRMHTTGHARTLMCRMVRVDRLGIQPCRWPLPRWHQGQVDPRAGMGTPGAPSRGVQAGSRVYEPREGAQDHGDSAANAQFCPVIVSAGETRASSREKMGVAARQDSDTHLRPHLQMIDQGPRTLGCTQYPDTNIGTIRTDLLCREGACIHLGPGNPNVHGGWISKGLHQVEGIGMSHVRLVGKGLDSAVP